MEFRYRGYRILASTKHDVVRTMGEKIVNAKGVIVYIFYSSRGSYEKMLMLIEMAVGYELQNDSDAEIKKKVIMYIDAHIDELRRLAMNFERARNHLILKRALSSYDNYECGKELYRLFRDSFEMTDADIAEQGFVELVPYFNKETYAVTIAGYMTDIGTEKTETGGYFFKFSEISRKFGLALPGDNMMLERIKNAFNKSIVKYVDTSSGFYLTFNEEYCPHIFDRFEEVSDDDEG